MVGLVIFAHEGLAQSFLAALSSIVGPQEQVAAVDVKTDTTPEKVEKKLDQAIKSVNSGDGVIILADLFGGSPANFSLARMNPGEVEVISGLNLAMLLKAFDLRARELSDPAVMARAIAREGQENIVLASQVLNREKNGSAE
jgi:PTS system mannose-specific IIA component